MLVDVDPQQFEDTAMDESPSCAGVTPERMAAFQAACYDEEEDEIDELMSSQSEHSEIKSFSQQTEPEIRPRMPVIAESNESAAEVAMQQAPSKPISHTKKAEHPKPATAKPTKAPRERTEQKDAALRLQSTPNFSKEISRVIVAAQAAPQPVIASTPASQKRAKRAESATPVSKTIAKVPKPPEVPRKVSTPSQPVVRSLRLLFRCKLIFRCRTGSPAH